MAKGDKAAKAVKKDEVKEEAVKKDEVPVESPNEEKKDETEEVAKEEVKKEEVKADEEKETSKTDETAEVKKDEDAAATKDDANEVKKEDESKKEGDMEVDGGGNGEKKEEAPAENKKKRGRKPKTESPAITPDPNKRLRRSSQTVTYQPEDFKSVTHTVQIFRGRGTKLKDLEAVRTSMDRFTRSSEEMHNAHRFLFTMRGKVPQAQVKGNILEFNGFLKYFDKDKVEKETMDKEDEEAEVGWLIIRFCMVCWFVCVHSSNERSTKPVVALISHLGFLGA